MSPTATHATISSPARWPSRPHRRPWSRSRRARVAADAHKLSEGLAKVTVTIKARVGEENRLYGSVTNADISEALEKQAGHTIDKRKVELEEPLRRARSFGGPSPPA